MRSFSVVICQPCIQVGLEFFHGGIEFFAEGFPQKLIQHGPVESFHKTVGPGGGHFGPSMCDIVQFQEDLVGMNHGPAAVLPAVIGQDVFDSQAMRFIERQNPIQLSRLLLKVLKVNHIAI